MFLQYSRVCTNDVESSQADQKGTVFVVFSSVALVWWRRAPKQHGQIPPRWPCFRDSLVARRCTAVLAPWRLGLQRCRRLLVVIPHVSSEFLRLAWWQAHDTFPWGVGFCTIFYLDIQLYYPGRWIILRDLNQNGVELDFLFFLFFFIFTQLKVPKLDSNKLEFSKNLSVNPSYGYFLGVADQKLWINSD